MKKIATVCMSLALAAACAAPAFAAEALPRYTYTGSDAVEAAVAEYTADLGKMYQTQEDSVSVPAPIILQTGEKENGDLEVYGNFWTFNYVLKGTVLECISGGEAPGILTLRREGDGWKADTFDEAEPGEGFGEELKRLSHGDEALLKGYYEASDTSGKLYLNTRIRYLREYVTSNGLKAEAYQDYGWEPVPLFDALERRPLNLLEGRTLTFSSGVGAWYTSLTFGKDGAFTGEYHDSNMGETGEGYPNGTVYECLFRGQMVLTECLDANTFRLQVKELTKTEEGETESIEDGVRYVAAEPYGLKAGNELTLYLPGTPVEGLPEGFLPWSHLNEMEDRPDELPFAALWNEAENAGFVGEIGD